MTDQFMDDEEPYPGGAPVPGIDGDLTERAPVLDDGAQFTPEWGQATDPHATLNSGVSMARRPGTVAGWHRLSLGVVAALALLASVVLPASRTALAETTLGTPIPVGSGPDGIAVNPITNRVYVANFGFDDATKTTASTVTVIDAVTNTVVGSPIALGAVGSVGVAVNQATNRIYVVNSADNSVTVIDGATNKVVGTPIKVGKNPQAIAVNSVTNRVYALNMTDGTVSVIDGTTNTVTGLPITVGKLPSGITVNAVTNKIYVANFGADTVSVIDGSNNTIVGNPIKVGRQPVVITANPITGRVYVTNTIDDNVSVIDGATNTVIGTPIKVGRQPFGIDVDPATNRVYVVNILESSVTTLDGATNTVIGKPIALTFHVQAVAVHVTAGRVYVPNDFTNTVTAIGIPFSVAPSKTSPGNAVTVTWSNLFGPNGADFVGLYESDAPNTSPLSRVFTNGTASAGGAGVDAGSVDLPIPSDLKGGRSYDVRLVSGTSGGTLARVTDAAPVAANDSYSFDVRHTLVVPAPGVLANDTDADSQALKAVIATSPTHGTATLQPDGALTYVPTADFFGTDSFTYRAFDSVGLSATATVTLTIVATDCDPRPRVHAAPAVGGRALQVHVESTPLNTQHPNPLRQLKFGTFQNAKVTLNGQPIDPGQAYTAPASATSVDFTVERATPGQATTVPFTVVDGCGEWPTFVGGGTSAGF